MKQLASIIAAAFLLFGFVAPVAVTLTGCAATKSQQAYKSADATITTVDAAMKGWADYVVAERRRIASLPSVDRLEPNAALLRKEGNVATAYGRYQDAVRVAQTAVNAAIQSNGTLPADVTAAAASLLEVLQAMNK